MFRAPGLITFPDSDVILGGPVAAPLDAQGAFAVTLPATDAPGMNPTGWAYSVAEQLAGVQMNRVYSVLLPAEAPAVDIADIAPTDPTTPTYVAVRGDSAYEVAVKQGFTGTVAQWLASLVGPKGSTGAPGADGDDAYEVAVAAGYSGTRAQWLASLVGPKGDKGDRGDQGPKGDQGAAGAPGVVQSVNGISAAAVTLNAAAVHAVPDTAPGAPGGVAQLDATGKVPAAQLPASSGGGAVATVAGKSPDANGNVALVAADVGAVATTDKGAASGVATLGTDGILSTAQRPTYTAAQVGALASTARGAANGVASLDSTTRIPIAQMPAAVAKNEWTPQALGFAAWSCDPYGVANPAAKYLAPQRLYLTGVNITENTTVSRAVMFARGYGGVSVNRYMAGIYREDGTRVVASSAVALTQAGQETGVLPAMAANHIGAVPLSFTSTTLTPGRYWVAWLMTVGGTADFSFFHVQNEAPVATANFFMTTTPFPRAWYIAAQSTLPTTVSPTASTALADHDIPIVALAA
ncbi:collagen-like protein [Streptomyces griseofuscus]|uniref:collagen-like triple helix repeat-containing protein n=1 Tax=Streptomyces griseofuscus TaxID=146922 RepID=UPI0036F62069